MSTKGKTKTDKRTGLRLLAMAASNKAKVKKDLAKAAKTNSVPALDSPKAVEMVLSLAQAVAMERGDRDVTGATVKEATLNVIDHHANQDALYHWLTQNYPGAVSTFLALQGGAENPRALDISNFPNHDKTAQANRATICTRETQDRNGKTVRRRVKCETALSDIKHIHPDARPAKLTEHTPGYKGLTAIVIGPGHDSQTQLAGYYALVPIKALLMSHQATGARVKDFDEHMIDPGLIGKNADGVVESVREWYAPFVLNDDITTQSGPPVIDLKWRVLTQTPILLGLEHKLVNPSTAHRYAADLRRALESHALQWGLSSLSNLPNLDKYIVVRVITGLFDMATIVGTLNSGWTSAQDMPGDGVACPAGHTVPTDLLELAATRLAERPWASFSEVIGGCGKVVRMLELAGWIDPDGTAEISNRGRWMRNTLQGHELTPNGIEAIRRCTVGDLFKDRLVVSQWGGADLAKIEPLAPALLLACVKQNGIARPLREALSLYGRLSIAPDASDLQTLVKRADKALEAKKTAERLKAHIIAWLCDKDRPAAKRGQALALSRANHEDDRFAALVLSGDAQTLINERFTATHPIPSPLTHQHAVAAEHHAPASVTASDAPQAPDPESQAAYEEFIDKHLGPLKRMYTKSLKAHPELARGSIPDILRLRDRLVQSGVAGKLTKKQLGVLVYLKNNAANGSIDLYRDNNDSAGQLQIKLWEDLDDHDYGALAEEEPVQPVGHAVSVYKARIPGIAMRANGDEITIEVPAEKFIKEILKPVKGKSDGQGGWVIPYANKKTAEAILDTNFTHHGQAIEVTDLLYEVNEPRAYLNGIVLSVVEQKFMGVDKPGLMKPSDRLIVSRFKRKDPVELGKDVKIVTGEFEPKIKTAGVGIGGVGVVLRINKVPLSIAQQVVAAGRASYAPAIEKKIKAKPVASEPESNGANGWDDDVDMAAFDEPAAIPAHLPPSLRGDFVSPPAPVAAPPAPPQRIAYVPPSPTSTPIIAPAPVESYPMPQQPTAPLTPYIPEPDEDEDEEEIETYESPPSSLAYTPPIHTHEPHAPTHTPTHTAPATVAPATAPQMSQDEMNAIFDRLQSMSDQSTKNALNKYENS